MAKSIDIFHAKSNYPEKCPEQKSNLIKMKRHIIYGKTM